MKVTPLFAGLLALMQVTITVIVGLHRARTGIQFLDGGDPVLLRKLRAHGNFTETVPMALIAIAGAELSGAPWWLLVAGGCAVVGGRILHYATIIRSGFGTGRAAGMVLTLFPIAVWGAWSLSRIAW